MSEIIDRKTIAWEFEDVADWSGGRDELSWRFAVIMNTLDTLKMAADEQPDLPFYFHMSSYIASETFSVDDKYNPERKLAVEAGYFMPATESASGAMTGWFDFIDKYKSNYADHRFHLDAFQFVIESSLKNAFTSKNNVEWAKQRNVFSGQNVASRHSIDPSDYLEKFPFMTAYEEINADNGGESFRLMLCFMREFNHALFNGIKFDNPNQEEINGIREHHSNWVKKFDRSNITVSRKGSILSLSSLEARFNLNPQKYGL